MRGGQTFEKEVRGLIFQDRSPSASAPNLLKKDEQPGLCVMYSAYYRLNHQKQTYKGDNSMKITVRTLIPLFVLVLLALSAVGVASAQNFTDIAGTIRSAVTRQSAGETEITGTITSITPESWTVDGTEFKVLPQTEVKGAFVVGDVVKVHLFTAADGSLAAREVEYAETGVANDNSNDNGAIEDDNGNLNDNDSQEIEDGNGNMNGNDNAEIEDDNGNTNGNGNAEIDDDNGNMNGNDNGGINDNDHGNANDDNANDNGTNDHSNDNDHHGSDDGNGNGHHGGDDDNGNGGMDD
jgi:Domain of unknown function (DUF5666)